MNVHYLDNSATTPVSKAAKAAMLEALDENFGNPSSLHTLGANAEAAVTEARENVLYAMGLKAKPEQLIFTSGGTEAANLAIIGSVTSKMRNRGKTIIIGEAEHDCVLKSAEHLEELGYKIIKIPSPDGIWDMNAYERALSPDVALVSAMLVNNETGAVSDVKRIAQMARDASPDVIVHTDAVQGLLKLPTSMMALGADLISVSGHKIGAPKGIGALYVGENILKTRSLSPVIYGGGQEKGYRSGTENVPGIVAFGAAAKTGKDELVSKLFLFDALRTRLLRELSLIGGIRVNEPKTSIIAKNIINITVFGIRSETMLHHLSSRGVYVSSGSACASNTRHPSNALRSFGISEKESGESIRVSFGVQNTEDDVDAFIDALKDGMARLVRER
ncbi:MAG: cysteine desulfurase [Clostridia bacterium]|nr:cysteine desulfurase [Clostridia bacterium]MBR7083422.1 cysteine desulfurase [Clostridia bacterium]